jgi:hypothetical protein
VSKSRTNETPRKQWIAGRELQWKKIPGFSRAWYARLNYAQWVEVLDVEGEFLTIAIPAKPDVEGNV